jgi:hypothetical protein
VQAISIMTAHNFFINIKTRLNYKIQFVMLPLYDKNQV